MKSDTPIAPLVFFKQLSEETRLQSLLLIAHEGELCVCELMEALTHTQPKISRHLALLKQQKILLDRRQGKWVFYRLNPALPHWITSTIHGALDNAKTSDNNFSDAMARLHNMGARPERNQHCC